MFIRPLILAALRAAALAMLAAAQGDVESALSSRLSRAVSGAPCVRLIGQDRDVGCSTPPNGVVGYLYIADSEADVAAFASLGTGVSRAVLLPPSLLRPSTLASLYASPAFVGALVAPGPLDPSVGFSPVSALLPEGATDSRTWNPSGLNLTRQRYNFPVVALTASEADSLRQLGLANKAKGNYASFPQHAVKMFYYMGPDGLTSSACLGAQQCLPLGGQSVWSSLGQLDRLNSSVTGPARPVIVATASLDAGGLFHDLIQGADATVSGLVARLAAAEALSRTLSYLSLPAQIVFAAFQGEAWGAIGSRRWLGEVASFTCSAPVPANESATGVAFCSWPLRSSLAFTALRPSDIATVVSADQVGALGLSGLYLHDWVASSSGSSSGPTPGGTAAGAVVNATFTAAAATGLLGPLTSLSAAAPLTSLPPSPVRSFVDASASPLQAVIISGYDAAFASRVYHSQYDNASRVDAAVVTAAATLLARSLYALATGVADPTAAAAAVPPSVAANSSLVSSLLSCITVNATCPLLMSLLGLDASSAPSFLPSGPMPLYPSVYRQPYLLGTNGYALAPSALEAGVRNFLALVTATNRSVTSGVCNATSDCAALGWGLSGECIAGVCIAGATAYYHDALSPAVSPVQGAYGQYTVNVSLTSASDPAWSEPYWSNSIGTTVYLKDSDASEGGVLGAGIGVALLSVAAGWALLAFLDAHFKVP